MKEIQDNTQKKMERHPMPMGWKNKQLKCLYYTKQSTDLMQPLSKYQQYFSQNWNYPKICMESQKTPNSQSSLEKEKKKKKKKKNKAGSITIPTSSYSAELW